MPHNERFDQGQALPPPAAEAGSAIRPDCQAARIGEVTEFAECLVKTGESCPHRLTFNAFLFCVHPQREGIIARTPAQEGPAGK